MSFEDTLLATTAWSGLGGCEPSSLFFPIPKSPSGTVVVPLLVIGLFLEPADASVESGLDLMFPKLADLRNWLKGPILDCIEVGRSPRTDDIRLSKKCSSQLTSSSTAGSKDASVGDDMSQLRAFSTLITAGVAAASNGNSRVLVTPESARKGNRGSAVPKYESVQARFQMRVGE
jgi:hypothetical protein